MPPPRPRSPPSADVALLVVGYTHDDEGENVGLATDPELAALFPPLPARARGEASAQAMAAPADADDGPGMGQGGDRRSLTLRPEDEELIARGRRRQPAGRGGADVRRARC